MAVAIKKFDAATAGRGHEGTILVSPVLPDGMTPPFWHQYGCLANNGAMAGHAHPTDEVYLVFAGSGYCILGGQNKAVSAGDVIYIPKNTWHTMLCTEKDDAPFLWAALWWEPIDNETVHGFHVRRFDLHKAEKAHGGTILAAKVLPDIIKAPFDDAYGFLTAGGCMELHAHPAAEVYWVCSGSGWVTVDGEQRPVQAGDVIAIPRNAMHTMTADSDLLWAAFWWK